MLNEDNNTPMHTTHKCALNISRYQELFVFIDVPTGKTVDRLEKERGGGGGEDKRLQNFHHCGSTQSRKLHPYNCLQTVVFRRGSFAIASAFCVGPSAPAQRGQLGRGRAKSAAGCTKDLEFRDGETRKLRVPGEGEMN